MKEYILSLTKELVSIPSVSSDIDQLHSVIDRIMREFDTFPDAHIQKIVHNEKPSLIVSNFDGKRGDICLNGHVDVVPSSEDTQFTPIEKDGHLIGRGTIDMKGAASCMIAVMKDVLGSSVQKKISLMLTCDEEVGGADGAGYLSQEGYGADVVLTPDAAGLHKIITAGKGLYNMSIEVAGKAAHSAYPWKGDNPIQKTMHMYQELKDTIEEPVELAGDIHWGTSVEMTMINAGVAQNAIPERLTCNINIRHTESFSEKLLKNMCAHILKKYDATILQESYGGLVHTQEDNPHIQAYKKHYDMVTGGDLQFEVMHGATDAQYFAEKGSVCILHGPNGKYLHSAGEYLEIESLYTLYDVTKSYVFNA